MSLPVRGNGGGGGGGAGSIVGRPKCAPSKCVQEELRTFQFP